MKKIFKFIKIAVIVLLGLVILAGGALYFFFPSQKIKTAAQNYIKENYNREIDFENVSMTLVGIRITKFRISEKSTFEDGTFVEASEAVLKDETLLFSVAVLILSSL